MNIYLDESGDLGFSFRKPYRSGGSSRYLTIAFLFIPKSLSHLTKRIVIDVYKKRKRPLKNELKGSQLNLSEQIFLANEVVKLLIKEPKIQVFAITVNKKKVKPHIRQDPNKLYNYMIGLILPPRIKSQPRVTLIPDKRSIKVQSGNSLIDYLKIKLLFEFDSNTSLDFTPLESHTALNLLFIDWICHMIWKRYEDNENRAFNILERKIKLVEMFFINN